MIDENRAPGARAVQAAQGLRSDADFWSLRIVDETIDEHAVRNDVAQLFRARASAVRC